MRPVVRVAGRIGTTARKGHPMKKIDVDKDMKRSKFLIKAMVAQVVIVFVVLVIYYAYLRS